MDTVAAKEVPDDNDAEYTGNGETGADPRVWDETLGGFLLLLIGVVLWWEVIVSVSLGSVVRRVLPRERSRFLSSTMLPDPLVEIHKV